MPISTTAAAPARPFTPRPFTPRPFTRRQARQNAAFLAALARTGNARLAARELGVHRATYTKRRARDAAFAAEWEMALAAAHAAFHLSGGARPPEILPGTGRGTGRRLVEGARSAPRTPASEPTPFRTKGGEPVITRTRSGRLQLRLARPGRMNKAAEQAFFRARGQRQCPPVRRRRWLRPFELLCQAAPVEHVRARDAPRARTGI